MRLPLETLLLAVPSPASARSSAAHVRFVVLIALWTTYYAGLRLGWWGHGFGRGWNLVGLLVTSVSVATTALRLVAPQPCA